MGNSINMRPLHTVEQLRKGYRPEDRPLPPEEKRMRGYLDRQAVLSPRHSVLDIPPVDIGIMREASTFEDPRSQWLNNLKPPYTWELALNP